MARQQYNTVQETKDYNSFSFLANNRRVHRGHIHRLMESMQEGAGGLLKANPILVNESFEIIDGQHRFTAAKELGLSLYYIVVPGLTIRDSRTMNALQRGWGVMDWALSYAEGGNKHYQKYLQLREDYNYSHSIILTAIYGGQSKDAKGVFTLFRSGELKIDRETETKARERLSMLDELGLHYGGNRNKKTAEAFIKVMDRENFNLNRFFKKIDQQPDFLMTSYARSTDAVRAFEDLYNRNLPEAKQIRLY